MACTKAVIFDYIGTLVNCKGYTMDASKENLYLALAAEGFDVSKSNFLQAYDLAHEKYRIIRFEQLREVTNAVWVAEALCNLGFKVTADDYRIKCALNVFFKAFVDTFELRDGAKKLLKQARTAMQSRLNLKLHSCTGHPQKPKTAGHNTFFNAVVVSEENWLAKTKPKIFEDALNRLGS